MSYDIVLKRIYQPVDVEDGARRSHLPQLRQTLLQALHEEDEEDREPASSPCFSHQIRDDSTPDR